MGRALGARTATAPFLSHSVTHPPSQEAQRPPKTAQSNPSLSRLLSPRLRAACSRARLPTQPALCVSANCFSAQKSVGWGGLGACFFSSSFSTSLLFFAPLQCVLSGSWPSPRWTFTSTRSLFPVPVFGCTRAAVLVWVVVTPFRHSLRAKAAENRRSEPATSHQPAASGSGDGRAFPEKTYAVWCATAFV